MKNIVIHFRGLLGIENVYIYNCINQLGIQCDLGRSPFGSPEL